MPDFSSFNSGAFDEVPWVNNSAKEKIARFDRDIYRLSAGNPVVVRFITDPGQMKFDPGMCARYNNGGTWVRYREVQAWDDMKAGRTTHVHIPVADYEMTTSGRKDRKDPLHRALTASDRDLSDTKWGRPYPKAKDMLLVNVVYESGRLANKAEYDPEPGATIMLAFSPAQIKALEAQFKAGLNVTDKFTLTDGAWKLLWHNANPSNPSGWNMDMVKEAVPPLGAAPLTIDGFAQLKAIRMATEADVFGYEAAVEVEEAAIEDALVEEFEAAAAEDVVEADEEDEVIQAPVAPQASNGANPFTSRSPAWIKGHLKKEGVAVPPRITNEELYALALKHLPPALAA